jgi:hypothetical protein
VINYAFAKPVTFNAVLLENEAAPFAIISMSVQGVL